MATKRRGILITDDFGGVTFYPDSPRGDAKPENLVWLPLAYQKHGRIQCSKYKVNLCLTMDRSDISHVVTTFHQETAGLLSRMFDEDVKQRYKMAENMKPCEIMMA